MRVGPVVFMDDIMGFGDIKEMHDLMSNLREMERQKKFEFNKEKSAVMIMNKGRKKKKSQGLFVKAGEVAEVENYEYLGVMINDRGNLDDHLKMIDIKVKKAVGTMKQMIGNGLGRAVLEVRILLSKTTIRPIMLNMLEAWGNL